MKKALTIVALSALPAVVSAQTFGNEGVSYIESITDFLQGSLMPLLIAASIIVFVIGIFWYFILGGSDETKKAKGKSLMVWGLVGFVLILIVQGLVMLLAQTTGLEDQQIRAPSIDVEAGAPKP